MKIEAIVRFTDEDGTINYMHVDRLSCIVTDGVKLETDRNGRGIPLTQDLAISLFNTWVS